MTIYQDNRQCKSKCWHECQCYEQTVTSHIFANILDSVMDQFQNGIVQQLEIRLANENQHIEFDRNGEPEAEYPIDEIEISDPDCSLVLVPDMDIFPDFWETIISGYPTPEQKERGRQMGVSWRNLS